MVEEADMSEVAVLKELLERFDLFEPPDLLEPADLSELAEVGRDMITDSQEGRYPARSVDMKAIESVQLKIYVVS